MKKLLFLVPLFVCSCHQSTENKLADAIIKQQTQRLEKDGEKVESIHVDSLHYELSPIGVYYLQHEKIEFDFDKEVSVTENELMRFCLHNNDTSRLRKIVEKRADRRAKIEYLLNLALARDSSLKIFYIKSHMVYKTNQSSFDGDKTEYLYADNMDRVRIDTDSMWDARKGGLGKKN